MSLASVHRLHILGFVTEDCITDHAVCPNIYKKQSHPTQLCGTVLGEGPLYQAAAGHDVSFFFQDTRGEVQVDGKAVQQERGLF